MQWCQLFCLIIKEYISRWIYTSNKVLTLSWRRSLSYRNQSIDLLCKLMNWFLYDKDIHHERVKMLFTHHNPKVCFLTYRKVGLASFLFFFYQGIFFTNIMSQKVAEKGGGYFFNSLLHNFIQQSLNSGSAQVQILLAVCRRFEMVRISNNGPGWK